MTMYGYANRKCGPANGTHDPLMAKVLVLEAGGTRMAIVTMDLGSMVSDTLRQDVASKLGIPVLLLAASHTHSAPSFLPFGSAPSTNAAAIAYRTELEGKIFGAIEQAIEDDGAGDAERGPRVAATRIQPAAAARRRAHAGAVRQPRARALRPGGPGVRAAARGRHRRSATRAARPLRHPRRRPRADQLQVLGGLPRRDAGEDRGGDARRAGDVRAGRRGRHQPDLHGAVGRRGEGLRRGAEDGRTAGRGGRARQPRRRRRCRQAPKASRRGARS